MNNIIKFPVTKKQPPTRPFYRYSRAVRIAIIPLTVTTTTIALVSLWGPVVFIVCSIVFLIYTLMVIND